MLKVNKLTTLSEMTLFADGYWTAFNGREVRSIHPLNPQIMFERYDNVFGVFDKDKLVGGFIVNNYPVRCFDGLTDAQIIEHTQKIGGADNCCELVSVWKARGQGGFSTQVWPVIIMKSLNTKKNNIVGSVYTKSKIKQAYAVLKPRILTTIGESNPLEVFYFGRSRFVGTFLANAFIRTYISIAKFINPNFLKDNHAQ